MNQLIEKYIGGFLIFCSGAKKSILKKCPEEKSKYMGVGATILFTGILGTLSGGYALSRVFYNTSNAIYFVVPFGLLWGLMIFNLDRLIVMNIRKEGSLLNELKIASGRIFLAIIISIVIAKPIEVKLFEDRISTLIEEAKFEQDSTNFKRFDETYGVTSLNNSLKDEQSELDILRHRLVNEEPSNPRYLEIKNNALPRKEKEWQQAENSYQFYKRELLKIYRPHGAKLYTELPDDIKPKADPYRNNMGRKSSLKDRIAQSIDALNKEKEKMREDHREQLRIIIKDKEAQIQKEEENIKDIEKIVGTGIDDATKATKRSYSKNLITQLEYLHKLTAYKGGGNGMFYIGAFITLLFLVLELSPILVKVFTKPGVYDAILMAEEMQKIANSNFAANYQHLANQAAIKVKQDIAVVAIQKWGIQEKKSVSNSTLTKLEAQKYIEDIGVLIS